MKAVSEALAAIENIEDHGEGVSVEFVFENSLQCKEICEALLNANYLLKCIVAHPDFKFIEEAKNWLKAYGVYNA